jgi:hypothetical protein
MSEPAKLDTEISFSGHAFAFFKVSTRMMFLEEDVFGLLT